MTFEVIKKNCLPNALNKWILAIKAALFLFAVYNKVEIIIFIAAAEHSYKQLSKIVVAIFTVAECLGMALLEPLLLLMDGIVVAPAIYLQAGWS